MRHSLYPIAAITLLIMLGDGTANAQSGEQREASAALQQSIIQDELNRRELAYLLAPIKAEADLQKHLSTEIDSPLDRLSSSAKWAFVDSLRFGRRGLGSYRYDILEKELTPTEIYEVLSLFGVQHTTHMLKGAKSANEADELIMQMGVSSLGGRYPGEDYPDYWCSSKATCSRSITSICIGSNC